ncbi:MAG: efflux RND transporter permease subunit [Candidatus Hydrogenedentes bacterium]|nr:efflux RND transporter permease subunit [Candidatus Hydrogenedentota bacterium]
MSDGRDGSPGGFVAAVIHFCLGNKLVVALLTLFIVGWGTMVAPFDWDVPLLPRNPVAVDAIPDLGENQQIVFTDWPGRSPQDVEDQITYPLTVALLGVPEVRTIRSLSMFGFSSIYVIFNEGADFYWTRSRVLEKLSSLPAGSVPEGVKPALGPDATGLGQIFWYTLEGRNPEGYPVGGWDPQELRSIQDWYVRYGLLAAEGVSEVASIGGYVQEYQIDVDPDAMRAYRVTLDQVFNAVRTSNIDVGARTIEVNKVEYVIRGLGFIKSLDDIRSSVIVSNDNVPITIDDVATVSRGPALRRGALDKDGAEAVGGVVVARYGANPLQAIKNAKAQIAELESGMPVHAYIDYKQTERATVEAFAAEHNIEAYHEGALNHDSWLAWANDTPRESWPRWFTTSKVTLVPFYDRTGLIYETLGTLNDAIFLQILVTIIVVIVMVRHLRSSIMISAVLPLAVLICFIAMKHLGVDANIVALSGIAIAIGTVVDMGIILTENILKKLDEIGPEDSTFVAVYEASAEVGSAVLTAIATTIMSFLPVFTMVGQEGKLFRPLAFTKTFVLLGSVIVALTIIPPIAHVILGSRLRSQVLKRILLLLLLISGGLVLFTAWWWAGFIVMGLAAWHLLAERVPAFLQRLAPWLANGVAVLVVGVILTAAWLPLGPEKGMLVNFAFVAMMLGGLLFFFQLFIITYPTLLKFFLRHKIVYLAIPALILFFGALSWLGAGVVLDQAPGFVKETRLYSKLYHSFPGLGKEFMPPLDEGSFLWMPTTMPHASIGEAMDVVQMQDRAITAIPEVESVVGKIGRAESALDPAPISMIETIILYKSEYITDENGKRLSFRADPETGVFEYDEHGELILDARGRPFRQWRDEIQSPDDIWEEILIAGDVPGTTSAPKLQPIAARLVMLQSGMRAPMGIKVKGPDLASIEQAGLELEKLLKNVPGVKPSSVIADRIVGKPYLEIDINREAIARYGITIRDVQDVVEVAIGGEPITTTVEGRERYPVRVRYLRELRDDIEKLDEILVPASDGAQIPLGQLAELRYTRGPQMIKSEDTFLTGYVLFDKEPEYPEVDVVEAAQAYLLQQRESGAWTLPEGVTYAFSGSYENQLRAQRTLAVVMPVALFAIFLLLYLQFRSVSTTFLVFIGIGVAWAGGFIFIWLYGQPWFMDFAVFGVELRDLFQMHTINLSVAIWVGFLALFGIASDDGVVIATYLEQSFKDKQPTSIAEIRAATLEAGVRRIRPCLMTTATTLLALLPVLTSTGRGSDIMLPMAIPSFGGMVFELFTLFLVPVLYCAIQEFRFRVAARMVTPYAAAGEGAAP